MQPIEIQTRCDAIGLRKAKIARLTGLHEDTVGRTLNKRTQPLAETLQKIVTALEAEELRLRDALIDRHGLPDLPDDVDAIRVGGVMRRIVRPAVEPKERAA